MSYFKNVKSFEDLKEQFKALARKNHPDCGGDAETMKAINSEYDTLFAIWKHRHNATAAEPTTETADSTRSEFYTQNGWKGSKHDWSQTTKEVAAIIRAYVKETYPTYKFSVRFSTASMCSEIHVELVNAPMEIYKQFEELTDDEVFHVWQVAENNSWVEHFDCLDNEHRKALKRAYDEYSFLKQYTEVVQTVINDVDREVKSYNYEDCDGMIDYFHVDFYYFGVKLSDKFKVVEKTDRIKNRSILEKLNTEKGHNRILRKRLADSQKENAVLSDGYVVEWCAHCENENVILWDLEKYGRVAFCPVCGQKMMLCNTCEGACDYDYGKDVCKEM